MLKSQENVKRVKPNSVNKQEIVSPNDQADPQPGQRPPNNSENTQVTNDAKTKTPTAVGSSALFGVFYSPTDSRAISAASSIGTLQTR